MKCDLRRNRLRRVKHSLPSSSAAAFAARNATVVPEQQHVDSHRVWMKWHAGTTPSKLRLQRPGRSEGSQIPSSWTTFPPLSPGTRDPTGHVTGLDGVHVVHGRESRENTGVGSYLDPSTAAPVRAGDRGVAWHRIVERTETARGCSKRPWFTSRFFSGPANGWTYLLGLGFDSLDQRGFSLQSPDPSHCFFFSSGEAIGLMNLPIPRVRALAVSLS
ncbi:hypothetical protein CPLU01_12269 [Colletotrichum plurivorum]|uniref:Uncharacterized protein n=1 Tax=Colletotrichum plurivorum TaxID=2175906 RepID=A0A8H6JYX8_9PEZI|nr:hypothetical protein CPLU01_12269 [Colletotrichum plurivorum]